MLFRILITLKDGALDAEGVLAGLRNLDKAPSLASFYRSLNKAVDAGYVRILDASEPSGRGRPRKRYRITRSGKAYLESEARRMERLARLALSERKS